MVKPAVGAIFQRGVPGANSDDASTVMVAWAARPFFSAVIVVVPGARAVTQGGSSAESDTTVVSLVDHLASAIAAPNSSRRLITATSLSAIVRESGAIVNTLVWPIRV